MRSIPPMIIFLATAGCTAAAHDQPGTGAAAPAAYGEMGPKALPKVGECHSTTIAEITSRLVGAPDSGSAVVYANRLFQVSYDTVPAITRAKVGDPVRLCVRSLPTNCPAGDNRGIIYSAQDFRTKERWTLPDAQHSCGGA